MQPMRSQLRKCVEAQYACVRSSCQSTPPKPASSSASWSRSFRRLPNLGTVSRTVVLTQYQRGRCWYIRSRAKDRQEAGARSVLVNFRMVSVFMGVDPEHVRVHDRACRCSNRYRTTQKLGDFERRPKRRNDVTATSISQIRLLTATITSR